MASTFFVGTLRAFMKEEKISEAGENKNPDQESLRVGV